MTLRRILISSLAAAAVLASAPQVAAQGAGANWAPSKDMRILLSSGPGSAFDVLARAASKQWPKYFGVSLDHVMKQPKDGHTIGLTSSGTYLDQMLEPTFPWKVTDIPVFLGIDTPPVGVLTGTKGGLNTWDDVRNAKRRVVVVRWGKLSMDIPVIKDLVGRKVDVTTASFGSMGPILSALQSGDGDLWSSVTSVTAMQPVKEGHMRLLFVYANKRLPDLPEVPTHLELGFPAEAVNIVVMRLWYAAIGTPPHILASLGERLSNLFKDPEILPWAKQNGLIYEIISGEAAKEKQLGMYKIITDNVDIHKKYGG